MNTQIYQVPFMWCVKLDKMKTIVIYPASNPNSNSSKVAGQLKDIVEFDFQLLNIKEDFSSEDLSKYDLYVFIVPTYGDEELQEDIENLVVKINFDMADKYFAICEIGNYGGYDDFSFGAMKILKEQLITKNAIMFLNGASVDSLPKMDWDALENWCYRLNKKYFDNE